MFDPDERFKRFVETTSDWVWEVDSDAVYTYSSPRVADFLGYDPEEIVGMSFFDLMPPEEARRVTKLYQDIARDRRPFALLRNINLHRDGHPVVLETSGVPKFDERGEFEGYHGIDRDITERDQAERALRDRELQYRLLFMNAPVCIHEIDLDGRLTAMNPAGLKMLDLTEESQVLGTWFLDVVDVQDRVRLERLLDEALDGRSSTFEFANRSGNRKRTFASSLIPIVSPEGHVLRVMGVTQDVTDQRQSEQALRRYKHIVSASRDLMAFVDPDYRYVAVNDAYARTQDLTPDEIVGRLVPDVLGAKAFAAVKADIDRCLGGESGTYERWLEFPGGKRRFIEAQINPFRTDEGTISGAVITARDTTDRKRATDERRRLDERIRHKQKLESLGILAGGIAHDFNNLLTAILGNASLIRLDLDQRDGAAQRLEQVERAAERAAELCNQLLAYAGKGRFVVEPLNLSKIVGDMADLLEVSLPRTAILERRLPGGLPAVDADGSQIRQVVMNLVTNAADSLAGDPGVIRVSTGTVQSTTDGIDAQRPFDDPVPGPYVYVEVSDNGCGMDDETRECFLDPFYTTKFAGRGLGMAATLGIVRSHRGFLSVETDIGRGTTIRVWFPATSQPAAEPVAPTRDAGWDGRATVMVVDDEEIIRRMARDALETAGLDVLTAYDGVDAVNQYRARSTEIDAVLLDLTMPRMNGEETYRELRRINDQVRVVLCSGFDENVACARFSEGDPVGFLRKPYRPAELVAKLRELVRSP